MWAPQATQARQEPRRKRRARAAARAARCGRKTTSTLSRHTATTGSSLVSCRALCFLSARAHTGAHGLLSSPSSTTFCHASFTRCATIEVSSSNRSQLATSHNYAQSRYASSAAPPHASAPLGARASTPERAGSASRSTRLLPSRRCTSGRRNGIARAGVGARAARRSGTNMGSATLRIACAVTRSTPTMLG